MRRVIGDRNDNAPNPRKAKSPKNGARTVPATVRAPFFGGFVGGAKTNSLGSRRSIGYASHCRAHKTQRDGAKMLPSDERDALKAALADVLSTGVWEAFTTNPILSADAIPLPESIEGEEERLGFLLLYLLDHAGMTEVDLHLEAWTLDTEDLVLAYQPVVAFTAGVSLAYAGMNDGACFVVYDPERLDDPTMLLGAAALAVGEAHRDMNVFLGKRAQEGSSLEDELEAIALGFGVLLANAGFHARGRQEHRSSVTRTATEGHLDAERLGYLLALQVKARGLDAESIDHLRGGLAATPADAFVRALDALDDRAIAPLGLPPHGNWPSTPPAVHRAVDLRRLSVLRDSETHRLEMRNARRLRNQEHPVFRVPVDRRFISMIKGAALGFPLLIVAGSAGVPALGLLALCLGTGGGLAYARTLDRYECSDHDCVARLDDNMERCPECGGLIVGEINHADDRLVAEEEWMKVRHEAEVDAYLKEREERASKGVEVEGESPVEMDGHW
jgi:hypothetical protein